MAQSITMLGVDIGTTSTKAVLSTPTGTVLAQHSIGYPLLSPEPGAQEQDPETILAAVIGSVAAAVAASPLPPSTLVGLCLSAAMHSLIAVDAAGQPLTASLTWADRRSAPWIESLRHQPHTADLYYRTGTPLHPMLPLAKLLWLRAQRPAIFAQAAKFISIKEYVLYRWFGQYVVDISIANATGLFNLHTLDWDPEALAIAAITPAQLSRLVPTTHTLTGLQPTAAAAMGISASLPVVVGASDGPLANLGIGAIAPDIVALTIGTSGALRATLAKPVTDPEARFFCYALTPNHWCVGGSVNSGGMILRWARDTLLGDRSLDLKQELDPKDLESASRAAQAAQQILARPPQQSAYDRLTTLAASIPAGADGLIFLPYLAGERSPLWNADARGSFLGLTLQHSQAHLVRAVMEGVLYNLRLVQQSLQAAVPSVSSIRASGGFARSSLWRQMLADIFEVEVVIPQSYESSCLGAVFLGLHALGHLPSLAAVNDYFVAADRHQPIAANVARYRQVLPVFSRLLGQSLSGYADLAYLQAQLAKQPSPP